jgi:hypothetical protein
MVWYGMVVQYKLYGMVQREAGASQRRGNDTPDDFFDLMQATSVPFDLRISPVSVTDTVTPGGLVHPKDRTSADCIWRFALPQCLCLSVSLNDQ